MAEPDNHERDARTETRPRADASAIVYAQLAAGMIVFGSATPVSKLVTQDTPVFIGSALRAAIGALVFLPFIWRHLGDIAKLSRRDWIYVFGIAVFGMFGFTAFLLIGMKMIPGVLGAIVMATTPAVTAGAAILFIGENVTWRKIAAIALAVAGVLVLHLGGDGGGMEAHGPASAKAASDGITAFIQGLGSSAILGSALVFGAVCCEAAYTLLGRAVSQDTDPKLVAFLGAALSLPLFAPLAFVQWPSFAPADVGWQGWSAILWYGAGTLALGTWLWYQGITKAQGSVAAGFMGLMPVSALVLSYILLGESPRVMHLIGFAVVFAGVLLISREHALAAREG